MVMKLKTVIMNHIKEDNPIYLSMTRLAKDEDWQYVIEAQEKMEAYHVRVLMLSQQVW